MLYGPWILSVPTSDPFPYKCILPAEHAMSQTLKSHTTNLLFSLLYLKLSIFFVTLLHIYPSILNLPKEGET